MRWPRFLTPAVAAQMPLIDFLPPPAVSWCAHPDALLGSRERATMLESAKAIIDAFNIVAQAAHPGVLVVRYPA